MSWLVKCQKGYQTACQVAYTKSVSLFFRHGNLVLFVVGVALLFDGLKTTSMAFDDECIKCAVGRLFQLIEGKFGGLIAVSAGIGAIIASAFGGFKAAWALLATSVGAFILRSLISLFFGNEWETECGGCGEGASGG